MPLRRPRVFVSYRRADAETSAGRIADALARQFRRDNVFFDTASIAYGEDFVRVVRERIAACDVVLVVIGPRWASIADTAGRQRLALPDDPVAFELTTALGAGKRIVPVRVLGAAAPAPVELPPAFASLARVNMASLRDESFAIDFDALVDELLGRPRGSVRTELDHLRRLLFGAALWAALAPLLAFAAAFGAWTGAFDLLRLDTHVQRALLALAPPVSPGPVLVAAIDAEAERRAGRAWERAQFGAWRADHARLVDQAAAAGARAVAFDLGFDCPADDAGCAPQSFEPLAAAARRAAARTPPMTVVFAARQRDGDALRIAAPLREAGRAATPCLFDRGGGALWSVPLAVLGDLGGGEPVVAVSTPALALVAVAGDAPRSADLDRRRLAFDGPPRSPPIGFSTVVRRRDAGPGCPAIARGADTAALVVQPARAGHWREPTRGVSYAALLDGAGALPLAGRIVVVGVGAIGQPENNRDVHEVADGFGTRPVYGVELHADAIAALAAGRVPALPGAGAQATTGVVASLAGAALAVLGAGWPRAARRAMLALAAIAWLGACAALARTGWLANPAYDIAALVLAYAALRALLRLARWRLVVEGGGSP